MAAADENRREAQPPPLCELRGITKAFPGVVANDGIDLSLRAGEVHALLGENGAGKTTLISVLSGMYRPDAGEIRFEGRSAEIDSPRAAIELGVGTVYQHLTLVPTLSVLENLLLGSHGGTGRLDLAGRASALRASSPALLGVDFAPDARAGGLALGQQQQVEIMKALWREGSRLLILDEPTSMLTPQGYEELRSVLVNLKREGLAVILITHKLHEAIELGDRVTVLRAGRVVGSLAPGDLRGRSEAELSAADRRDDVRRGGVRARRRGRGRGDAGAAQAAAARARRGRARDSRAGARRRRGRGRAARRRRSSCGPGEIVGVAGRRRQRAARAGGADRRPAQLARRRGAARSART